MIETVYTPLEDLPLEVIDNALLDHDIKLDERRAWREDIQELRKFWDEDCRVFTLEYEGVSYETAIYTFDRRDGETELEFCHFAQTDEGLLFAPSPACRLGHARLTLRYLVKPEDAERVALEQLGAWVEYMKPIRIKQDADIITYDDIRAEMCKVLKTPVYQGQTWDDYKKLGGITDEELAEVVKMKFGSSGRGAKNSIRVSREGSGYRLYMSWTKYPSEMDGPTIQGKETLAMAREVLQTEHGLLNPDRPQMSLF